MGHRALVAYERADGRYAVHHAQWGADGLALLDTLGPATPLGTPATDPPVEPTPVAVVDSPTALADRLDYLTYETVYVADRDWHVRAHLALWTDFLVADGDPERGLLVAVGNPTEAATLRQWFRSLKAHVGRLVERGRLGPAVGRRYLEGRVREHVGCSRHEGSDRFCGPTGYRRA